MSKKIIKQISSTVVPMPVENIDTDQIIPARFLKTTAREGLGKYLFYDLRLDEKGKQKDFVLNDSDYGGEILAAGRNFGSGSSREHAAWALADFGFKAVISSSFADIFKNNALNNGLLPIEASEGFLKKLFQLIKEDPEIIIEIDLEKQAVRVPDKNMEQRFEINQYKKMCLMNGHDDVDYLLSMRENIRKFEIRNSKF